MVVLAAVFGTALLLSPVAGAFANPYVGWYAVKSPAVKNALSIFGDVSYSGTSLSGLGSSSIYGILTVAGISSTTATHPSSYLYQNFPSLKSTGEIRGNSEVWKATASDTSCTRTKKADPASKIIVTTSEYSSVTKITEAIGFQDTAKTIFRYHWDVYKTSGSAIGYDLNIAKSSYDSGTDPTKYFMVGDFLLSTSPVVRIKYTQMGVEQTATTNTGWKVKESNYFYTTPTAVGFSTIPAKSLAYTGVDTGDEYNSLVTYHYNSSVDAYCFAPIGTQVESNAGADYNLKTGVTVPKGEVRWFHTTDSTKKISKGTPLWN
jgi:hypothetical protein